jgi:DNA-binding phage protein
MNDVGILAREYESSNNPGAINPHDDTEGRHSYGAYQFYGGGIVQEFVSWLCTSANTEYVAIGKQLSQYTPSSDGFDGQWIQMAKGSPAVFLQAQTDFATLTFYDPAVAELKVIGFDATTRSNAIQNVIMSAAIQFSAGEVPTLFQQSIQLTIAAKFDPGNDEFLIKHIYHIKQTDPWLKNDLRLIERVQSEGPDALILYTNEMNKKMEGLTMLQQIETQALTLLVNIIQSDGPELAQEFLAALVKFIDAHMPGSALAQKASVSWTDIRNALEQEVEEAVLQAVASFISTFNPQAQAK